MTKFAVGTNAVMPKTQGETTSHAPRTTLIHSSQTRKETNATVSFTISRKPTRTAFCVAIMSSPANCRIHGETHNQMPSTRLAQSSHCLGGENVAIAMLPPRTVKQFKNEGVRVSHRQKCN